MFYDVLGWFEALNDRLIGSKTWDPIVRIFRARFGQSVTVHGLFGLLGLSLCYKSCVGLYEAENDHEIWVHKVKPILGIWP